MKAYAYSRSGQREKYGGFWPFDSVKATAITSHSPARKWSKIQGKPEFHIVKFFRSAPWRGITKHVGKVQPLPACQDVLVGKRDEVKT